MDKLKILFKRLDLILSGIIFLGFSIFYAEIIFLPISETKIVSFIAFFCTALASAAPTFVSEKYYLIRNNDTLNTVVWLLVTYGILTIISYCQLYQETIAVLAVLMFFLSALLTAAALFVFRGHNISFKHKLTVCLKLVIISFSILCFILIFIVSINNIRFGKGFVPSRTASLNEEFSDDFGEIFLGDDYRKMNLQEKLCFLQSILNNESDHLQLDKRVRVCAGNLMNNESGRYIPESDAIIIDLSVLETKTMEILKSCLHEVYHAKEIQMVQKLNDGTLDNSEDMEKAVIYADEFETYYSGQDDFQCYYDQTLEKDARAYAQERIYFYVYLAIDQENSCE